MRIEPVTSDQVPLLLTLIRELAEYEELADEVVATEAQLHAALFGSPPAAHALIAHLDGEPVAYAIWFHSFSSFAGRKGLFIEDIYVRPHARGHGVGKALFLHLAGLAHRRDCGRMEWAVLDWNQTAIDFYRSLGARPLKGWTHYGLDQTGISALANRPEKEHRV